MCCTLWIGPCYWRHVWSDRHQGCWQLASCSALNCDSKAPTACRLQLKSFREWFLLGHWSSLLVVWRFDLIETSKPQELSPRVRFQTLMFAGVWAISNTDQPCPWDDKRNLPFASICLVPSMRNKHLKIVVKVQYTPAPSIWVKFLQTTRNGQVEGRASPNISISQKDYAAQWKIGTM